MVVIPATTAGLVPLQAPLPAPRVYDLLHAASLVDPATNRWLAGAWIGGDVPGPAFTFESCSDGTNRVKQPGGAAAAQIAGTFQVYLVAECTAQSIGPSPTYYTDRLKLAFQVYEGAAVERVMATGDGHSTLGSYLGDPNMEQLGSTAVQPLRAFELLEDAIAEHGGGILHAPPSIVAAWDSLSLTVNRGNSKFSVTSGSPIANGAGYIGAVPDGEAALGADEAWAFASGPIEIYRGDIQEIPGAYSQAIDRSMNDVLFLAERPYLINWIARQDATDDDHLQAGVLVDLTA